MRAAAALVVIATMAVTLGCQSDTTEIEDRLDAIEAQLDAQGEQIAALAAATPSTAASVVLQTYKRSAITSRDSDKWCVAYVVGGKERTACWESRDVSCYQDAIVGEPLPQSCR